jgi:hypothetical protein
MCLAFAITPVGNELRQFDHNDAEKNRWRWPVGGRHPAPERAGGEGSRVCHESVCLRDKYPARRVRVPETRTSVSGTIAGRKSNTEDTEDTEEANSPTQARKMGLMGCPPPFYSQPEAPTGEY